MQVQDAFDPLRAALEKAGIRYAVGGSWASTFYGEPRFTNDVDILAEFTVENVAGFLKGLPDAFFADADEAQVAIRAGRPFNVIYMPMAFKFDFFPAGAFALGVQELDRAVFLNESGLSGSPVPFVTPEDILIAKLDWYRAAGEVSEVQWRDIRGIVVGTGGRLDHEYLRRSAETLGIRDLLERAVRLTASS
ncbi:MAG: hypothetical protein JWN34_3510 [Bryobacterales bacterium]|nr:hypothetical protein [Bryobacterales bacterium]